MIVLEDVVERGDVGVVQSRDRPRFPLQSLPGLRAGRFLEGFQRDSALQAFVVREVDGTHRTRTQHALDLVGAEPARPA